MSPFKMRKRRRLFLLSGLQFYTGSKEHLPDIPSSSASQSPLDKSQSTELGELDDPNTFSKFLQIKQKNETLKANT